MFERFADSVRMSAEAAEQLGHQVASKAPYVPAAGSIAFGLSGSEWSAIGVIAGIVLGVATLLANIWYKRHLIKLARQGKKVDE